ncbi:hypothetical protein A5773_13020 [Mycobacterium sp. 852014-52450_SCH5900713]|uniref:hypothetical protein n=1 Tax=Mycobacterium sp. 852014-52450_SCH5900713 TaxID=1834116 RepID=UPI0007FF3979|nr:hypothetical protein [Mycobacterium sp. 852014-52450_SCH5900713]OBF96343.1 hypothetical protein A5773_13020 [Mycobacterium sp. 852014-52450_SCH5900713]
MTDRTQRLQGFTPMAPHLFTPSSIQAPVSRPVMNPRVSTQVRATDRAEALAAKAWAKAGKLGAVLFDRKRVPKLAELADAAAAEFYTRCGEFGDMHYDTHDTDWNPHAPHEQGVVRVWAVGTNHVDVIRDRWRDVPNRMQTPVDYFASMYGCGLPDFFDCARYGCTGDCDRACSVRLAKSCTGPTRAIPVNRGTLVLLFRCCRECEALAGKLAANTYKTAVIDARVGLPPGAVIMPNPDPSVNPDAWA